MKSDRTEIRTKEFEKNYELESYLKEINLNLKPAEMALHREQIQEYPVIFVMGALRSGTTLMMQWLAETGEFAYPTNLLSRFYGAPILGSKIQRMLTDEQYNFRDELADFKKDISYESNNGKTKGVLEPNEFWFFWRRFLPENIWCYSDEELLEKVRIEEMRREFYGIAQVFEKPLALKGMICNYNIGFLNEVFPKCIFIWNKRDLERNAESVINARKRQYGTDKEWYSFIIPEYSQIAKIEDVKEQAKEQICCINNAIEKGLSMVSEEKKIVVQYEEFCELPRLAYEEICDKLRQQGYYINKEYKGKNSFVAR